MGTYSLVTHTAAPSKCTSRIRWFVMKVMSCCSGADRLPHHPSNQGFSFLPRNASVMLRLAERKALSRNSNSSDRKTSGRAAAFIRRRKYSVSRSFLLSNSLRVMPYLSGGKGTNLPSASTTGGEVNYQICVTGSGVGRRRGSCFTPSTVFQEARRSPPDYGPKGAPAKRSTEPENRRRPDPTGVQNHRRQDIGTGSLNAGQASRVKFFDDFRLGVETG